MSLHVQYEMVTLIGQLTVLQPQRVLVVRELDLLHQLEEVLLIQPRPHDHIGRLSSNVLDHVLRRLYRDDERA